MKALILNCTLKKGGDTSNTKKLIDESVKIFDEENVGTEVIRVADYNITPAMEVDAGEGDQWPEIFEKVKKADILIIGTPIWLGERSSIANIVIERLYAASSFTNDKGQYIYYNKVGGVIVTGNEDGAKNAASYVLYSLSHIGFTIPPNVDTYWVGEAGPGPSYIEAEGWKNDFTMQASKIMTYNLIHFARLFKEHPIPTKGNVIEDKGDKQENDVGE